MPANQLQYLDFEIRIAGKAGDYHVHVYQSPGGEATGSFQLPFHPYQLKYLISCLSRIRATVRGKDSEELEAARELGGALFQAVFQGQVRDVFRSSLEKIQRGSGLGLRLKLRLQDAPELADLPWEFLYDADRRRFLALFNYTPIIRYIELPESVPPLSTDTPLRILGLVSSPGDYAPLNVDHEKKLIEDALKENIERGLVELTWLEKANLIDLRRRLQNEKFHVLHYIGHGGFDKQREQGILIFEDENGRSFNVTAERLAVVINSHRSLRLVVLNACEGARNLPNDPFAGVATALAFQGLPAVVAMQFSISDPAAIKFADEFYTAVAHGYPVDASVAVARNAIFVELSDVEWGTPVLFMRSADGVLFRMADIETVRTPIGQPDSQILMNTSCGAYNEGSVSTEGGDFIGKDQSKSERPEGRELLAWEKSATGVILLGGKKRQGVTGIPRLNPDIYYLPDEPLLGFIEIPAGKFLMGSDRKKDQQAFNIEEPQHEVYLSRYYIARCPVTVSQFQYFVNAKIYTIDRDAQKGGADHPVVRVAYKDASAYCYWLTQSLRNHPLTPSALKVLLATGWSVMLPSEAQWEKAARGTDGRIYPWGNSFNYKICNTEAGNKKGTTQVGFYSPAGDSPFGCADMAGNAWEWTCSRYKTYPYNSDEGQEDLASSSSLVVRGGSWDNNGRGARCAFRFRSAPGKYDFYVGFRVVVSHSFTLSPKNSNSQEL